MHVGHGGGTMHWLPRRPTSAPPTHATRRGGGAARAVAGGCAARERRAHAERRRPPLHHCALPDSQTGPPVGSNERRREHGATVTGAPHRPPPILHPHPRRVGLADLKYAPVFKPLARRRASSEQRPPGRHAGGDVTRPHRCRRPAPTPPRFVAVRRGSSLGNEREQGRWRGGDWSGEAERGRCLLQSGAHFPAPGAVRRIQRPRKSMKELKPLGALSSLQGASLKVCTSATGHKSRVELTRDPNALVEDTSLVLAP